MSEPRILVVEDDPIVCGLFLELLPEEGWAVEVAEDAEQALDALKKAEYDLVLADKNLPGMNGIQLLTKVRAYRPDLDVIIMTAYPDMPSILAAIEAGVYDYLVKPFNSIDDVILKIERALGKRRMTQENKRFVDYLTQANEQIEAMNQGLEAKIAERTLQLEQANARLKQLSLTDDVTGLYNQRFLHDRLNEEFRRAMRHGHDLAVIMIDVDHFKQVNDNHDHLFGSAVLRRLGARLNDVCRSHDYVCRYGGDEYAIILPHTSLSDAVSVGERLRADVEAADLGDDQHSYWVTISIGVAAIGDSDAETAEALLQDADRALYLAKEQGRNQIAVVQSGEPVAVVAGIGR